MDSSDSGSLVQRRLRYLERQRALGRGGGGKRGDGAPRGSGPLNQHGLPELPTGQHEVPNWPVLDLGDVPDIALQSWRLDIGGWVESPVTLTWEQFSSLPQVDAVSDFHCVTTWSRLHNRWTGVRFRTLAELVVPGEAADWVLCTGSDRDAISGEAYTTNLPLARAVDDDVMLVHRWEGAPLPREHGGPVRMITPRLYAWKGTKWICRIEFLDHEHKGFWERRGYSDTAEPWLDDRYASGPP